MRRSALTAIPKLLPNEGSRHATPASLCIDLHYAKLEIQDRWTWDRFIRLASFVNLTPYELGSLACITHRQVTLAEVRKSFGCFDRSAALVLTLLEAHWCKTFTNDVVENPFPNLNTAAKP